MKISVLAIMLLLPLVTQAAPKVYVTDRFEIQLRAGQGPQQKILKSLPSGTPLRVLQTDSASGYSLVALNTGEQGWVLSRYLTPNQPLSRAQIEENIKKLDELGKENTSLKTELTNLKTGKESVEKVSQDLSAESERLKQELVAIRQASANALQIQAERDQLQENVINLERQLETIKRENLALDATNQQNWFLIGAGVLFGGILLGLILPRLSWRKRSTWNSF